jgi:hypothetical protein
MENTTMMKGIALFATLTGVYQWLGNGTSLYDVMIILLATFLVVSMEPHEREQPKQVDHLEVGDNQQVKRGFFSNLEVPLRGICTAWA